MTSLNLCQGRHNYTSQHSWSLNSYRHLCLQLAFMPSIAIYAFNCHLCLQLPFMPSIAIYAFSCHLCLQLPFMPSIAIYAFNCHLCLQLPYSQEDEIRKAAQDKADKDKSSVVYGGGGGGSSRPVDRWATLPASARTCSNIYVCVPSLCIYRTLWSTYAFKFLCLIFFYYSITYLTKSPSLCSFLLNISFTFFFLKFFTVFLSSSFRFFFRDSRVPDRDRGGGGDRNRDREDRERDRDRGSSGGAISRPGLGSTRDRPRDRYRFKRNHLTLTA